MSEVKDEPPPPTHSPEKEGGEAAGSAPGDSEAGLVPVASSSITPGAREVSLTEPERPGASVAPTDASRVKRSLTLREKAAAVAVAVAVVVGLTLYFGQSREPKDDFGRFQGEWQLAVPAVDRENKPAARPKPVTIRVTGDRWVYIADGKERGRYALTLRPEAEPKEIDLVQLGPGDQPTAFVIRGVYTIERNQAKIAYAPNPDPRPTGFENADVWLLERVK